MKITDGCTACADMAYNLSELAFIYPITPSSPMASEIDNLSSKDVKNIFDDIVDVVEMQSEAGAAGALHGALSAGILASTFTSSQGLLLMIPNMYKMAGECLPGVIHVAARSLATHALSIFGDHQDIYATRQTGFCILASSNVQDAQNLALVAHLSAIKSSLPFLHFFDGFRTSHEYNKITEINKDIIKELVDYNAINNFRSRALNSNKAKTHGTNQNEDIYFQSMEARNTDYIKAADNVSYYMDELNKKIGTNYKPFNYYGSKSAKYVIIAMGSVCDTIKEIINNLNNEEYGLIEVHLYRPFNSEYLVNILPKSTKKIAVLDRTKEHGSIGEPLFLDVVASLKDKDIEIVGGRYGLSSKNTTPNDIYDVFKMLEKNPKNNFTVGIVDDVTNTSLEHYDFKLANTYREFKIFGFGSDGMVSASKNMLKILGEEAFVQGYFEYDSKKSGGVTISHLRLSDKQINAPYYVTNPELVVVSKDEYFYKFDLLDSIKSNGILLINTRRSEAELNKFLPNYAKKIIRDKNIKVYTINAEELSLKYGLLGKISLILESAILYLLNINNFEERLIKDIRERFLTKGKDVVDANIKAVKEFDDYLYEVNIDNKDGFILDNPKNFNEVISSRKGSDLKVSDLLKYKDGTFEGGTSALEKRKMSELVVKWDKDKCIECGFCSLFCPHAVIRPFLVDEDSKYAENGKDCIPKDDNKKFIISVSEADCTGCGVCVKNCPGHCLEFGRFDKEKQSMANELFSSYKHDYNSILSVKNTQFKEPLFEFSGACAGCGETAYIKLLTQIVGRKLVIANATGCSSIYGASCPNTPYKVSWGNSLFEDNAEFAFGILNTYEKLRKRTFNILKENIEDKDLMNEAEKYFNDYDKMFELKAILEPYISKDLHDYILPKSVWAIGGDGWAYDIGFGGIDHVLSSNKNIKLLVLDTEVYSNTGGQSSKSTRLGAVAEFANDGKKTSKKDLFKIAMTYPNIYVAQISLGANMVQTLNAIKEAEEHNGPAIIIAYAPCVEHGIKGGMSNSITSEKLAVECGYVLLMRYFDNKLYLDSSEPDFSKYDEFLLNETRYSSLKIKNPAVADSLLGWNQHYAEDRYNYYKNLANKN